MEGKLTKNQERRKHILEYFNEQMEFYAITYSVEKTAKQFKLTPTRIWQILREEEKKSKTRSPWSC